MSVVNVSLSKNHSQWIHLPARLYRYMTNNGHLITWTQIIVQSLLLFCEHKDANLFMISETSHTSSPPKSGYWRTLLMYLHKIFSNQSLRKIHYKMSNRKEPIKPLSIIANNKIKFSLLNIATVLHLNVLSIQLGKWEDKYNNNKTHLIYIKQVNYIVS